MHFFLKSIDCWQIVESARLLTFELILKRNARLANDKALHALCQALSPSEFARISNYETALEAWQMLETTYEGTKLVKSAKLQMLIFRFEEIKMLEEETFKEFYTKISVEVSRSFSVEDIQTSRQHRLDARSSFSNFYTELDFSRHCLGSFCKMSTRHGNKS